MTFAQLHYAVKASEIGSISKAARLLLITQANLSSTIKGLEKEIGVTLFTRNKDGITLTPEGEIFMVYAQKILHNYDNLMHLSDLNNTNRFVLGGTVTSFAVTAFARLCSLYQDCESIRMAIMQCESIKVLQQLQTRKVDAAIFPLGPGNRQRMYEEAHKRKIKLQVVGSLPMNVYLRRGHPLLENYNPEHPKPPFDFSVLHFYPYVDYVKPDKLNSLRDFLLRQNSSVFSFDSKKNILVESFEQKEKVICTSNAFGIGISCSPSKYNPDLVRIPFPEYRFDIAVCSSTAYPENPFHSQFYALLTEELMASPDFIPAV